MLRRRFPPKKFVRPPPKRLCTIQPRPEFSAGVALVKEQVAEILSKEKEIAKKNRPKRWSGQPKPSTQSILTKGFPEFEYVLRPLIRPSLAFGSKIPRNPKERVIQKHRLKIKRRPTGSKSVQEKQESHAPSEPRSDKVGHHFLDLSPPVHHFEFKEEIKDMDKTYSVATGDEDSTVGKGRRHKKTSKLSSYDKFNKSRLTKQPGEGPSPATYNINRFPQPVKPNKFGFNSATCKFPASSNDVPSAAAYYIDLFNGKVKMHCTLGGKQTISLPTMIRCLPENRNLCKYCQTEPEGNFMYSQTYGTVCRECFKKHSKSYPAHVFSSFQAAKHCKFMHFHDQHTTVRKLRYKEVIKSVRREACINRFPDLKKNVKKDKDDQKEKISDNKPKPFKRVVKVPKRIKPYKPREIQILVDTAMHKSEQRMSEEQVEQQRQSAEREYEMLAKEYAYQQMKGRHSILPIFNLLNKEEDKLFPILTQDSTRDKSDFQKKLIERFGSSASFYGTLIPEFREKGVVHAIDPESDKYVITAKGRDFYNKTPLAWELTDDLLLDDELLRVTGKNVLDELEDKMQNMCRAKDIVVPPLPRTRLSEIIAEDSAKPLKPHYSTQLDKPIISRDYDIPKSYWYNIDR